MKRKEILDNAEKCVCGNREEDYGNPENNFKKIADFWNVYLGLENQYIDARDVAMMMALLKIARIRNGQHKADNYIDLAGYAACGGEIDTDEIVPPRMPELTAEEILAYGPDFVLKKRAPKEYNINLDLLPPVLGRE